MGSDILTVDELHHYLKIPRPTIYTLAQQGRIPAAKIGKHWRFTKSSINQWLQEQQQAHTSAVALARSTQRSATQKQSASHSTNGHS